MCNICFSELLLVFVVGLVVLGPQRFLLAVQMIAHWVRTLRLLAITVQNELVQEVKLHEFQQNLQKVGKRCAENLMPELKVGMVKSIERSYAIHEQKVMGSEVENKNLIPATTEYQDHLAAMTVQPVQVTNANTNKKTTLPISKTSVSPRNTA